MGVLFSLLYKFFFDFRTDVYFNLKSRQYSNLVIFVSSSLNISMNNLLPSILST